ncbi:MAG: translocation/assembly module TamB domain-containing protein [Moraxella sp.]|uniref:translocation/assembly module TamB domain-containing protein n=1 Tax=Moraxella sp. TaxID=479 RepID=UPI0026DD7ADC|nr:translocation/assembly module TamB domain-containing protein [Moraxella sp.]MDO4450391.1 translocation/assembly module TamB domain-containing protein [Moraxella sp.]
MTNQPHNHHDDVAKAGGNEADLPLNPPQSTRFAPLRRFVLGVFLMFVVVFLGVWGFIASEAGTRFVLEKIIKSTGVTLTYQDGTLYRGVQVADVVIAPNEDMQILVNHADIQLGWRSLLAGQVHLSKAHIDRLDIINEKPPTDSPFEYPTLNIPMTLRLQNIRANVVSYQQIDQEAFYLYDIALADGKWSKTHAEVSGVSLDVNRMVSISGADGKIDLQGDYPLNVTAAVQIPVIEKAYFDVLHAKAYGTLKRTYGTVISQYNKHDIHGEFSVQSLDKGVPFSAKLYVPNAVLPYANEQNMTITDGVITADGVVSRIELRVNTDLTGKYIPTGRYYGRGIITHDGMEVVSLTADTASGQLYAHGDMDWSDEFVLHAKAVGEGVHVRDFMPREYREYQAYLPQTLTGALDFRYFYLDKDKNETRLEFDLTQKDGERVLADLSQHQGKSHAPWHINANWQNLVREGVPHLDGINSPHGSASIILDKQTRIDAKANIDKLSTAPSGDYQVQMVVDGHRIHINDFGYQGKMGDLSGKGQIDLAHAKEPLTWQFDVSSTGVLTKDYLNAPIELIEGNALLTGRMLTQTTPQNRQKQLHDIEVVRSDLTATLSNAQTSNTISLNGQAKTKVTLLDAALDGFEMSVRGKLRQDFLPKLGVSDVNLVMGGDTNHVDIKTLSLHSPNGRLTGEGKVGFAGGIDWDIDANLDGLDTVIFSDNHALLAKISGDIKSVGAYKDDKLTNMTANFNGKVSHAKLPEGTLVLDLAGENQRFKLHNLTYAGTTSDEPSSLSVSGHLDAQQMAWDLVAQTKHFDLGGLVQGMDSDLTGNFATVGAWGDDVQQVAINELDMSGHLRGQKVLATGSLSAKFSLPKDFRGYLHGLKNTPESFDLQSLTDFQKQLDKNTQKTRQFIHELNANRVQFRLGDNIMNMHGTEKNLTTTLNLTDLSQIMPTTRGAIKGGLVLVDDRRALPTIYVDINANDVRTADIILQKANVVGKVVNLGNSPSQFLVEVSDVIAMGRVLKSARVDFKGTQSQHELAITTKNTNVEVRAKVAGGFDERLGVYEGVLGEGRMETRFGLLSQRQPTQFSVGLDKSLKIAPHCWQTTQTRISDVGVVCLNDTFTYLPDEKIHADVVVQNLDTAVLSPALPTGIFWRSKLNGKAKVSHKKGNAYPQIQAVLYSDNGRVGLYADDTGYVEVPYERVSLIAQSTPAGLKLRADVAGVIGEGYVDVIVNPFKEDKPISGAMVATDIDLSVLRPFLPSFSALSGMATLQGGLGGTLSRPLFYGNAEMTNGRVAVRGVPMDLTNIELDATISGTQADLVGRFMGGQGTGKLTGKIDWQNELQAKFDISANDLAISSPPVMVAQISPEVEVVVKPLSRYVDIKGVLAVPSAIIRPPQAQDDVVAESTDVSVLDRGMLGDASKVLSASAPWSINANIGLDLGDDVVFRGFGAKVPLAGALFLTQSGQGSMQARGVIQVSERTKIDGVGQNLEINYAQIRFNGDLLNPRLSMEAQKEVEGQTVGLRIKGVASSPEISVFNNAGLTEQQAMNAIVTGRLDPSADSQISEQGFRSQVANNLAAAGLSLGLSGTRSLTNQIGSALGLESLTVDASGNSNDTHVNITGYITPDLYIRYGVGVFNAKTELSMRYQLTRRVYVEAVSATEKMVDMIYRWKF